MRAWGMGVFVMLLTGQPLLAQQTVRFEVWMTLGFCGGSPFGLECGNPPHYATGSVELIFDSQGALSGFGEGAIWIGSSEFTSPRLNAANAILLTGGEGVLAFASASARPEGFTTSLEAISNSGGSLGGTALFQRHGLEFAQFADGLGLFSQVVLFSLDDSAETQAHLVLLGDDGRARPITFTDSVSHEPVPADGVLDLSVPASGMRKLETDGSGSLTVGSVRVLSDRPLAGIVLFGGSSGLAGVGASTVSQSGFSAPLEVRKDAADETVDTGIAVTNLESRAIVLTLTLRNPAGVLLATTTVELPALGHLAKFVGEFAGWNPTLDLTTFTGILRVSFEGRVAATVIQTRPGQFATMPIVPAG